MSLQDQGYRFIMRGADGRWVHPSEVLPTDTDCTDMGDDEFAALVQPKAKGYDCPDCPATPAVCASVDCCVRWA